MEIKYADFRCVSRQTLLNIPTNTTSTIYETSCQLFHELWNQEPVRLLGIRTSKLESETEPVQMSLFEMDFSAKKPALSASHSSEKQKKLDAALDNIRKRYGKDAVTRGSQLKN